MFLESPRKMLGMLHRFGMSFHKNWIHVYKSYLGRSLVDESSRKCSKLRKKNGHEMFCPRI